MLQSLARDAKTESRFTQILTALHGGSSTLPKKR